MHFPHLPTLRLSRNLSGANCRDSPFCCNALVSHGSHGSHGTQRDTTRSDESDKSHVNCWQLMTPAPKMCQRCAKTCLAPRNNQHHAWVRFEAWCNLSHIRETVCQRIWFLQALGIASRKDACQIPLNFTFWFYLSFMFFLSLGSLPNPCYTVSGQIKQSVAKPIGQNLADNNAFLWGNLPIRSRCSCGHDKACYACEAFKNVSKLKSAFGDWHLTHLATTSQGLLSGYMMYVGTCWSNTALDMSLPRVIVKVCSS